MTGRRARWQVAAALASVLALAGFAAPGAPGAGDGYFPTYGNGGYNVRDYDLTLKYNPASDWLTGNATIRARAAQPLSRFNLDLVGLTVRDVTIDDARPAGAEPAGWGHTGHELVVQPHRAIPAGEDFVVRVRYGGIPVPTFGPFGVFPTDDGVMVLGQPESAAFWFPANDHPIDKATFTFRVRVPNGYEVAANGLPVGTTSAGGWTTHVWRAGIPMATYLATIDVGQWNVNDRTAGGVRIIDAVDPNVASFVNPVLARQGEMLTFLESQFGDYPFNTAGAIVDDHPLIFFALETQTRPVYGDIFFRVGQGSNTVVHELAHQWFGDSVALSRWRDIWLNEGFATYAEWLWAEHEGIADAPAQMFRAMFGGFPPDDPFWDLPIGNPGPDHLFDGAVYIRGAMTLQALRERVGDTAFFQILQTWAATNKNGHGTTAKFIALAQSVSGRRLDGLFNNWLFAKNRPTIGAPAAASLRTASTAPATDASTNANVQEWRDGLAWRLAHGQR